MSVFRVLVKNSVKKIFMKKKYFNNFFYIYHKSDIKTFFNWIFN